MQIIARSARRVPVTLAAKCRVCRQSYELNLIDLSEYGCQLATSAFDIRAGDRICLRPEGLAGVWGDVIWVRDGRAGVRFDHSLHPAVVDHLARAYTGTRTDAQSIGAAHPRRMTV